MASEVIKGHIRLILFLTWKTFVSLNFNHIKTIYEC